MWWNKESVMETIEQKNVLRGSSIKLSVQYGPPWNDQRRNEGANEGDQDGGRTNKSTQLHADNDKGAISNNGQGAEGVQGRGWGEEGGG